MSAQESPAQRAARQLADLMKRHHVKNAGELESMMAARGFEPIISQVTIRRILKAEARTAPEQTTLRRLAEFLGESFAQAFPEPEDEQAIVVDVGGRKLAFKAMDGKPISPSLVEELQRRLTVDRANEIHEAKKRHRKKD